MNTIAVTIVTLFVGLCTSDTSVPSTHINSYQIKTNNISNKTEFVRMTVKPTHKPNKRPEERPSGLETCPSHNVRPVPARPVHRQQSGTDRSHQTTRKTIAVLVPGRHPATVPTTNGAEPDRYALRRGRAAFGMELDFGAAYAVSKDLSLRSRPGSS